MEQHSIFPGFPGAFRVPPSGRTSWNARLSLPLVSVIYRDDSGAALGRWRHVVAMPIEVAQVNLAAHKFEA